jgi:transposase
MKNTTTISIDLAKNVFQVAVFNKHGKLKSNQKMNDKKMAIPGGVHIRSSAASYVISNNARDC